LCPQCDDLTKFLDGQGVQYELINVDENPDAAREAESLAGTDKLPVVTIGEKVLVGFDKGKLKAALA